MRILNTGGSGFIGTDLVELCVSQGLTVFSPDVSPPRNVAHRPLWGQVGMRDVAAVRTAIDRFRPTHIAHLAARTDLMETRSLDGYAVNIKGVRNLITACAASPVKHTAAWLLETDYLPSRSRSTEIAAG